MGLNMNYGLLMQGNTSKYKVNNYNSYKKTDLLSEEYLLQNIVEFNQCIRESIYFLRNIHESIEETDSVGMVNGVKQTVDKVYGSIDKVKRANSDFFDGILGRLKELLSNRDDNISNKYRYIERIRLLEKSLMSFPQNIQISDIKPNKKILDPNYPNQSVLGMELPEYIIQNINNILNNKDIDNSISSDRMILRSCGILNQNFLELSAETHKIFGSNMNIPMTVSVDLYNQACDNFEVFNYDKLYSEIDSKKNEINKYFISIETALNNGSKCITNSNGKFDINNRELYYNTLNQLTQKINSIFNVINTVIATVYTFTTSKYNRLIKIISDSDIVIKAAHRSIEEYQHLNAGNFINPNPKLEGSNIFNPNDDDYKSLLEIQSDFNIFTIYLEEAFMENEYQESFTRALLEAEEGTNTDNNQQNTQNNQADSKLTVLQWLNNLIIKFQEALKRFKMRFEEFMIKQNGKRFWEKNKEAIGKITFNDTTVNEWYDYDFDNINKQSYVKFDVNADYMKSDEAFQNKIIEVLGGEGNHPKFEEKDKFADKIKKLMYLDYIKQDNGALLSNTKFDAQKAYNYIDHIITNGFNSDELNKISEDSKALSKDRETVNRDYENLKNTLKTNKSQQSADDTKSEPKENNNTQQQQQSSNTNSGKKPGTVGNGLDNLTRRTVGNGLDNLTPNKNPNESAIEEDDELKFNLAHHFGLFIREASFTVGAETAKSATSAGVGNAGNENKDNKKELDAMIKRCFNFNTIAITARMTAAIAAYKQYMDLYRTVVKNKKPGKENNNQEQKK